MQAGVIGSVEVASAPMARDAEAVLPSVVTAGPASVNGAVAEGSLSGGENAADGGAVSRDGGMERGIAGTTGAAMVGGDGVAGCFAGTKGAAMGGGMVLLCPQWWRLLPEVMLMSMSLWEIWHPPRFWPASFGGSEKNGKD
ncbi:hypothetical protein GDO81_027911 [Engystomops pustulosus]|uniref:Uncharacterized protein n=1 Tax=Engystomops pustulosus TaxID=76066 RepID=A0AAV6YF90_ENGPU|nr:hypothetical protein GDO81_027911 [Engystomops pustulosus]